MTITTEMEPGDIQVFQPAEGADPDAIFEHIWHLNPDARIEQTATGEILIMPPVGGESAHQSGEAFWQLSTWAKRDATGQTFDSSITFRLPNGAKRSPDASWVPNERIRALPKPARKKFLPFSPDFAIEVKSPSDRLKQQQEKCLEYIANGTYEAWLIDPEARKVYVYSTDLDHGDAQTNLASLTSRSLPSFTLDLNPIWQGLDI